MRRAFLASVLFATVTAWPAVSFAEVTTLPTDVRKQLVEARNVPLVQSMRQIPTEVVQACAAASTSHDFRLADAGERWEPTDVITNKKLLQKRLIWSARVPGYHILHYEIGGRGHSYHIMIVAFAPPRQAKVVWAAAAIPLKTYGEFIAALKAGKLDDRLDYVY